MCIIETKSVVGTFYLSGKISTLTPSLFNSLNENSCVSVFIKDGVHIEEDFTITTQ